MASDVAISLDGLTKYYGEVRGIEDLTFSVDEGEIFGVLGPNGAGKSTAIRLLLGLIRPTGGTARLLGHDVTDRDELVAAKERLGYITSDMGFYGNVTGDRLLDYFGRLKGEGRRAELVARFPFPVDRRVRTYSRGNKQKLAIVQAFMHEPDLLVMDEPTSGLDPLVQTAFYDLIERECERGATVFFSSHVLSEVRRVCDRAAVIRDGRLVAVESITQLLAKSGKVVRVDLVESPSPEALVGDGIVTAVRDPDGYYRLIVTDDYDGLVDRLDDYSLRDLEVHEANLEDVFMHFYTGDDV